MYSSRLWKGPKRAASLIGLFVFTGLLAGCDAGSRSGGFPAPGGGTGGGGGGGPVVTTNRFNGTATLSGGRSAVIDVTGNSQGAATGTCALTDPSRAAAEAATRATFTGNLTGTYNSQTGAFTVSGTVNAGGQSIPVNISGTAPTTPGGTGNFSGTIGGESVSGTLKAGAPTGGGGGGGGDTGAAASFSNVSGVNANTSEFNQVITSGSIRGGGFNGFISDALTGSSKPRGVGVVFAANSVSELTAGKTYTVSRTPGPNNALVFFSEAEGTSQTSAAKSWQGNSGQVIIDSVSGNTVKLRVVNAAMSPAPASSANGGNPQGTFTLNANGSFTVSTQ